jgi:hypothetical protein
MTLLPSGDRPFHFQPSRSPVFESESCLAVVCEATSISATFYISVGHSRSATMGSMAAARRAGT